jgi:hypothetical protein
MTPHLVLCEAGEVAGNDEASRPELPAATKALTCLCCCDWLLVALRRL